MACKESEGKCFTFLWKLENISFCLQKKGERIESPSFVIDAIDQTKWKLWLYPRGERYGNYIRCFLSREADSKGADKIEIKFEIAFIAKDGSVLHSFNVNRIFRTNQSYGQNQFIKIEDIFISKRSAFLPEDCLTIRCRMWKSGGDMKENILCTARTRILVLRKSFLWKLENFSILESETKYNYQIKSVNNYTPLMSVDLLLTGLLSPGEIIRFELSLEDQTVKLATLKLSLIGDSGRRVECNNDEILFDSLVKCKQFTFSLTKKKLMAMKSTYLQDDVLQLHWEWTFSKGVVSEEIEEVQNGSISLEKKFYGNQSINIEKKVSFLDTLSGKLKSLYDKKFLCNINLKTKTRTFPAHKIILSAASPVFSAMFSNEMKEKDSDGVNIDDLNEDTVSGMLSFIYTGRVENLSWESASHLYVAADKYDIPSLKNICSSYLKDNLSPNNSCEVLLLSDFHADDDLMSAVQDYILKHIRDIVSLEEWRILLETNAKLAAETVCLQYK